LILYSSKKNKLPKRQKEDIMAIKDFFRMGIVFFICVWAGPSVYLGFNPEIGWAQAGGIFIILIVGSLCFLFREYLRRKKTGDFSF